MTPETTSQDTDTTEQTVHTNLETAMQSETQNTTCERKGPDRLIEAC